MSRFQRERKRNLPLLRKARIHLSLRTLPQFRYQRVRMDACFLLPGVFNFRPASSPNPQGPALFAGSGLIARREFTRREGRGLIVLLRNDGRCSLDCKSRRTNGNPGQVFAEEMPCLGRKFSLIIKSMGIISNVQGIEPGRYWRETCQPG